MKEPDSFTTSHNWENILKTLTGQKFKTLFLFAILLLRRETATLLAASEAMQDRPSKIFETTRNNFNGVLSISLA